MPTRAEILPAVTDAAKATEAAIAGALRRAFPRSMVVGEEASARVPALLDALCGADLAFGVDPIDGAKNVSAGLPLFGVRVALRRGELLALTGQTAPSVLR